MSIYILDTETTGLHSPQPVEIAYFKVLDDLAAFKEKVHLDFQSGFNFKENPPAELVFNERFKPNKPIDPGASKITGIWPKDVYNKPNCDTFELPEDCEVIIGHNIAYDHRVLSYKDPANPIDVKLICTKELAQLCFQADNTKNNKLVTLIEHFYPEHVEMLQFAHGAYQDCLFVYMLLKVILERLPKVKEWDELVSVCSQGKKSYEQLSKNVDKLETMPFGKYKGKVFSEIPVDYCRWLLTQGVQPPLELALKDRILSN